MGVRGYNFEDEGFKGFKGFKVIIVIIDFKDFIDLGPYILNLRWVFIACIRRMKLSKRFDKKILTDMTPYIYHNRQDISLLPYIAVSLFIRRDFLY